jgi:hypothetical protein
LTILCGNRGRVHNRSALTIVQWIKREHAGGGFGDATECADKIDLNDEVKGFKGKVFDVARFAVATRRLDRVASARAVDQNAFLTMRGACFGKACINAFF